MRYFLLDFRANGSSGVWENLTSRSASSVLCAPPYAHHSTPSARRCRCHPALYTALCTPPPLSTPLSARHVSPSPALSIPAICTPHAPSARHTRLHAPCALCTSPPCRLHAVGAICTPPRTSASSLRHLHVTPRALCIPPRPSTLHATPGALPALWARHPRRVHAPRALCTPRTPSARLPARPPLRTSRPPPPALCKSPQPPPRALCTASSPSAHAVCTPPLPCCTPPPLALPAHSARRCRRRPCALHAIPAICTPLRRMHGIPAVSTHPRALCTLHTPPHTTPLHAPALYAARALCTLPPPLPALCKSPQPPARVAVCPRRLATRRAACRRSWHCPRAPHVAAVAAPALCTPPAPHARLSCARTPAPSARRECLHPCCLHLHAARALCTSPPALCTSPPVPAQSHRWRR
ncbi:hypothetical protein GGX14DRAFT_558059 [Mycena pura]|uniref:Uncharacterized protein n=1 Tax=Mycena pura TaxID=153505 RepID=A0AAD6YM62_9AGAR|nr:hypothetical protein GGX14DRAFT_558059 [Mycena pura]